ncbi:DUF2846 domain-containing protein [Pseudomonas sp. UL073]|uniref:DUF2846 domain-containing protein n=1 Tax=Zestomonas insulae TaxID=2809017 RepID=A0ABS2IFE6_9GAMM|nr:DUF2846 domain-containing protein [Pseudomonas insulae]MBM7061682.1 DUF2846 domain-containing protein [Pseudomonas insulae]
MRRHLLLAVLLSTLLGCSTPGAFFGATEGPSFQPHQLSDGDHALVYLYRPQSDWADQELEAPALFINHELIGSLPSNGYLVLEFDIASYQLEMRRPLLGSYWTLFADGLFDFTKITSFALDAGAGGVYYLRYDELNPPPLAGGEASVNDGPLQLVSAQLGAREIAATHLVQPYARIDASGTRESEPGFWQRLMP